MLYHVKEANAVFLTKVQTQGSPHPTHSLIYEWTRDCHKFYLNYIQD
jgi:hypothetical protein